MNHILIVDDDSINCVLAKHALGSKYRITAVASGKEALEFLEREIPDLILMDIEMPNMSGIEVVNQIKERESFAKIPIIFLTADSDPATEAECLRLGADDFITKPFIPVVMCGRVSKSLELQKLRRDLETQLEKKTRQMEVATIKSLTDAMTGLYNRVYLEQKLKELISEGRKGALLMIDLDNFKTINDTYGHIVGDKTLQQFSEVLKEYAQEKDIMCRLAGDEFVAFLTDLTDRNMVAAKAEGIIKTFNDKMGAHGYGGIVSVSIGIMITQGDEEFQSLYSKADKSLYFVKNNGKNAYHFYGEQNEKINEINTIVDLEYIQRMMEDEVDYATGAFHLAYDEFKKIYDFVKRCVTRKKEKVQIVLLTLDLQKKQSDLSVENIMQRLEEAVISSLRAMDAGTRYSNSQYILILMDTDVENGKGVAKRVIENFYESSGVSEADVIISYDVQTIEPKK